MVGKGTDACLSGKPLEVTWAPGTLLSADIITTINFNIQWSKVKPFASVCSGQALRDPGALQSVGVLPTLAGEVLGTALGSGCGAHHDVLGRSRSGALSNRRHGECEGGQSDVC